MAKTKIKTSKETQVITGFKGFNKDFKCVGNGYEKQYTPNSEHEDAEAKACKKGLHFCEYPLDVFGYYPPGTSRYAEVEGGGKTDKEVNSDSKVACTHLKIGVEVSIEKIIKSAIKFTFDRVKWTKENTTNKDGAGATSNGDNSGATSNGDNSGATSNGYNSGATSNGDNSGATSNGNNSGATSNGDNSWAKAGKGCIATAIGLNSKAAGAIGSWLTISECEVREYVTYIIDVKTTFVDGKKIKADTFYKLVAGKIIEA